MSHPKRDARSQDGKATDERREGGALDKPSIPVISKSPRHECVTKDQNTVMWNKQNSCEGLRPES